MAGTDTENKYMGNSYKISKCEKLKLLLDEWDRKIRPYDIITTISNS